MILATANEKKLLEKLQNFNDHGGGKVIFELTHDEASILLMLIKVGIGARAVVWLGTGARQVLFWCGSMYVAYLAFGEWLLKMIRKE